MNKNFEKIPQPKKELPQVLMNLGFSKWTDFSDQVEQAMRLINGNKNNSSSINKKLCRKLLGNEYISDDEYKVLSNSVESALGEIKRKRKEDEDFWEQEAERAGFVNKAQRNKKNPENIDLLGDREKMEKFLQDN